ncbi:MAG: GIY-YIG nuclease family protein [Candidatus Colwellbacteria bacterium]|nr:GIY-YIG nuclease family protein [Candidatus Colwellbacteria bacterium]
MYYVYVLKDQPNGEIYIGYSQDLERRIQEHKRKKPELVYYEAYKSEKDARMREMRLKQHGQTKRRLKERLQNSLI